MKFLYLLGIAACSSIFASDTEENVEETTVELTSGIEPLDSSALFSLDQGEVAAVDEPLSFEKRKSPVYLMTYGQYVTITGGVGAGFRTRTKYIGFEGNAAYIFPVFFKASANAFLRLSNQPDRGIYLGGGYGHVWLYEGKFHSSPYVPLFIGYEGERFFSDIGIDVVFEFGFPLPTFRYGVRF